MCLKEAPQALPCEPLRGTMANDQYEKRLLKENLQTTRAQGLTPTKVF
jgi:hypothetical protein